MNKDQGPFPAVVNIEEETLNNNTFRTALWTGKDLQLTLMSIEVGGDIGLEIHNENDQFLRLEQGKAKVSMGKNQAEMQTWEAEADFAIFIPSGYWHNVENIGDDELKIYSIYGPAHHPSGTVHTTRAEADLAEEEEHHQ